LIIEDELFDKISEAAPAVNVLMELIGKVDVTLSFSTYLKSLPNGVDICRPTVIDTPEEEESAFQPCINIQ
jgi:DNA mismatch repair ATPase MutS